MRLVIHPKEDHHHKIDEVISFRLLKAEFIGTFILIYFSQWSRLCVDLFKVDYVEACLCSGITLMLLTTLGEALSDATFNPAICLTNYLIGKLSAWKMISCIIVQ